MSNQGYSTLRKRAVRAWRKERPKRKARLLKRSDLMLELRGKLEEVLGDDLPIEIVTDLLDRPIATIEELRFTLSKYCDENRKQLILLDTCPHCNAETAVTINSLADLGQLFAGMGRVTILGCTKCLDLTDGKFSV